MINHSLNKHVTDRASFAEFIGQLLESFQKNKGAWENDTLEKFLEAMQAYAIDIQGFYDNKEPGQIADIPSWKVFADILKGASVYE
jgi:hypothetical protein